VSLKPQTPDLRSVDDIIAAMRPDAGKIVGPSRVAFLALKGGPPRSKPISIKVRGERLEEIRRAAEDLKTIMAANAAIRDVTDDAPLGQREFSLRVNADAARRAGIGPNEIARTIRLLVDGEIVASMQDRGEELDLRIRAKPRTLSSIDAILRFTLPNPSGGATPLRQLVTAERARGPANVRHYNFRRAITVEAEIDTQQIDTVSANSFVLSEWNKIRDRYPDISLDFSGELDDVSESLSAIGVLALLGLGLIYLILGTQFASYFQPFMILLSIPLAFIGVTLGLLVTRNPVSLFTLYGVVALAGIAVNSAIVLISAANDRLRQGMSVLHATVYAARRRVIPILITTLTTMAGLFSLATGLGGKSLLWGPVATAIVWGLGFSTALGLLVIPLVYRLSMARSKRVAARRSALEHAHA
jgi:multidrug efflux pump subunit AcrB